MPKWSNLAWYTNSVPDLFVRTHLAWGILYRSDWPFNTPFPNEDESLSSLCFSINGSFFGCPFMGASETIEIAEFRNEDLRVIPVFSRSIFLRYSLFFCCNSTRLRKQKESYPCIVVSGDIGSSHSCESPCPYTDWWNDPPFSQVHTFCRHAFVFRMADPSSVLRALLSSYYMRLNKKYNSSWVNSRHSVSQSDARILVIDQSFFILITSWWFPY